MAFPKSAETCSESVAELSIEEIQAQILAFLLEKEANFEVNDLAYIKFGPVNGNSETFVPPVNYLNAIQNLLRDSKIVDCGGNEVRHAKVPAKGGGPRTVRAKAARYRDHRGTLGG